MGITVVLGTLGMSVMTVLNLLDQICYKNFS